MCDPVLQTSEQNHLSQNQEDCNAPKWNYKATGTALTHVNHSEEQGQDNTTISCADSLNFQNRLESPVIDSQTSLIFASADGNKQNHLTCPKECISASSPPFLAFTVNPAQVPVIQAAIIHWPAEACENYTIIRIATVQHELHQLRRKLDDTKMRLLIEIKMRKQAASDLRALRAELTQKKIHSALILQSRKSGI
ncbi:Spermatogenesis-associated protein 1 [Lonchura striata]|uniref:Spermatogenesis-associated protein 1 n=1 Tax=Lonchura striata TaxID=40157 RepID=A0A218VF09_9PASE|nr:Spermatogenesis-associated protein 1 [Lonchura striata domestica]